MSKKIKLPRRPIPKPTRPHKVKKDSKPKYREQYGDDSGYGALLLRHWLED